jgi:hypothetical protein
MSNGELEKFSGSFDFKNETEFDPFIGTGGILKAWENSYKNETHLTPYFSEKLEMSRKANKHIEEEIFPKITDRKYFMFENTCIQDNDNRKRVYNSELSVDYTLYVMVDQNKEFLDFDKQLVQVRALKDKNIESVTITLPSDFKNKRSNQCEWNNLSHLSWFIWGFYNEEFDVLIDWICVKNPQKIKTLIISKVLDAKKIINSYTGQPFYSIKVAELEKLGLIAFRKNTLF